MRVVVVAEQLRRTVPGGIGTYVRGLAQGLSAMGADAPDLALWASRGPRNTSDPLAELGPTVVTSPLPSQVLTRAWDRGWAGFGSRAGSGDESGTDVIHATSLAVPPRHGAPVAVTVHDLAWRKVPDAFPPRGRRWHEAALGRAVERASLFVVPSRTTADALIAAGARADRVEVVDEGSDHLPDPDHAACDALLARLGVGGPFLLSVGTLEPRKNIPRLVAAYQIARPRLPEPWPLVVVGPTGWGDQAAPAANGVVMAGWVADPVLASLYGKARLVAYVPLLEGFGLPALEAMAAGAPVVASPMPSTGDAALGTDPRDVDAIAAALVAAATDDDVRADRVAAGSRRAAALTWETAARGHVDLWRSLGA